MNETKQDKQPTWRRHLNQGVASIAMVATSGLTGCSKTPEEELRETAYEAAAACKDSPPATHKQGRKRNFGTLGAVNVSVPCEMAEDKAAIDREVAKAAIACANPGKDPTTIYYNNNFIAACTRMPSPEIPVWNALAPSAVASAPAKPKPEEKKTFAARAASAPQDSKPAQR